MNIPQNVRQKIHDRVFLQAKKIGYERLDRIQSGRFIDKLVADSEIGGILKEYFPRERIRTHIKDGILNAYSKQVTKQSLACYSDTEAIKDCFGELPVQLTEIPAKINNLKLYHSESSLLYIVSQGTALKWETALRKALDWMASAPISQNENFTPLVCLKLSVPASSLTQPDKEHIIRALAAIKVKAVFCET